MNNTFIYKAAEYQGELFKKSVSRFKCSSFYFMWRFLTSETITFLDKDVTSYSKFNDEYVLDLLNLENPSVNEKEGEKINQKVLYWIGFIYRFLCASYNYTSNYAFKMIKPTEMVELYNSLHTQSPEYAVDFIKNTYDNIDKEFDALIRKMYL